MTISGVSKKYKLSQQGDETFSARRELLNEQREQLVARPEAIRAAKERLDYKISCYDEAIKTGVLNWKS